MKSKRYCPSCLFFYLPLLYYMPANALGAGSAAGSGTAGKPAAFALSHDEGGRGC